MFSWFKRKNKPLLSVWHIEDLPEFKKIYNADSIQYVNADQSIIIYLSALHIPGNDRASLINYESSITVTKESGTWLLKGSKTHQNQVLVCAINIINEADVEWAKRYFAAISPR